MNMVILTGNLTAEPEVHTADDGVRRCNFRLAVNRDYKDAETGKRSADFIPVVCWNKLADLTEKYLHKGSRISVIGSLRPSHYTSDDGNHHYRMDVRADKIEFLSSKGNREQSAEPENFAEMEDPDANLPF